MGRPRSDLRAQLLTAARTHFLALGVDGTSLRAVAEDAHTSIGLLRYYFPSKDQLFLAVVEETYVRVLESLEAALDPQQPVAERVRALYRRLGTLGPDELAIVRLVIREALTSPPRLERLIERFRRGHLPLVFALVRDGLASRQFDASLAPALIAAVLMVLGGPAQQLLRFGRGRLPQTEDVPEGQALADALSEVLLKALAPLPRAP